MSTQNGRFSVDFVVLERRSTLEHRYCFVIVFHCMLSVRYVLVKSTLLSSGDRCIILGDKIASKLLATSVNAACHVLAHKVKVIDIFLGALTLSRKFSGAWSQKI